MNLLHLFDTTEARLSDVKDKLENGYGTKEYHQELKEEKEYLLDILALLFKELER